MKTEQIIAVRLREYDGRHQLMKSYTTASGKRFHAGFRANPSPWRVDVTKADVAELSGMPEFEVRKFSGIGELEGMIDAEMQDRARAGQPAIRAAIESVRGPRAAKAEPRRDFGTVVHSVSDLDTEGDEDEVVAEAPPVAPPSDPGDPDGDENLSGPQERSKRELMEEAEAMGLDVHRRMRKDQLEQMIAEATQAKGALAVSRKNVGRRS